MHEKEEQFQFGSCPIPLNQHETIQLAHGSGGQLMNDLIHDVFINSFKNPILENVEDQATLNISGRRLTFSTDTFVIDPIFFPGGNIGELAVNGTVNDVCMSGATPLFLSTGMILEEGFSISDLKKIVDSMAKTADKCGVKIVTGDTKVVNRGKGDKIYINTSGIGLIEHSYDIGMHSIKPGDKIIVSGTLADHGIAVLSKREGLTFQTEIKSDTAALNTLVQKIIETGKESVHSMRDLTRGGLASALNEFSQKINLEFQLDEEMIPLKPAVKGACELLGLDPLQLANEGKMVVIAAQDDADKILTAIKQNPLGKDAAIIGTVGENQKSRVIIRTPIGGWRFLDMLVGEPLPRIC